MTQEPKAKPFIPSRLTAQASYEGDAFRRKDVGGRITRLVDGFVEGGVIGVDGRWGEGKTWLADHWSGSLDAGYTVVRVDAFATEFGNDPFAAIAQALYAEIKTKPDPNGLVKSVITTLGKAGLNFVGNVVKTAADTAALGLPSAVAESTNKAIEAGIEKAGEEGEQQIEEWLGAAARRAKTLANLRDAVARYVASQPEQRPIVVVIDELDRCRPGYALRTLDVLKHLFDMPGMVFVLFVNREQIESMIASQFGANVGSGYLSKFVHVWVPLTQSPDISGRDAAESNRQLLKSFAGRTRLRANGSAWDDFIDFLAWTAASLDFNARDIERLVTLVATISNATLIRKEPLFGWLLLLKVKHPDAYNGVVQSSVAGHRRAEQLAREASIRFSEHPYAEGLGQHMKLHEALTSERTNAFGIATSTVKGQSYSDVPSALRLIEMYKSVIES